MDSELLREREAFKAKAMAVPVVENRNSSKSHKDSYTSGPSSRKRPYGLSKKDQGPPSLSAKAKLDMAQFKQMGGSSSQYKFGVLTKIVRHMRHRHMEGEDQALSLDEILDETSQV